MTDREDKIVAGLAPKEETTEKISGGLGIKETINHTDTRINEDSDRSVDINIPQKTSTQNLENNRRNPDYPPIRTGPKSSNIGLKVIIVLLLAVCLFTTFIIITSKNNNDNTKVSAVGDNIKIKKEEEDVIYNNSGKTTIKEKTKKADTTLTSGEKESIEELINNFYEEHTYATNSGDDSYVLNYLTQNGDYRIEYEKLMEEHLEMTFELMEVNVISVIKQNSNTYMVTVKDKMKIDRPESISVQAVKTVYEVRQVEGEFLIHSIKSETRLNSESEVIEKKEPVIEEPVIEEPVIEEPVIEEPAAEEPVIEEPAAEEPITENTNE